MSGWSVCLSATSPSCLERVGGLTTNVLQISVRMKDELCDIRTKQFVTSSALKYKIFTSQVNIQSKTNSQKLDHIYLVFGRVYITLFMINTFKKESSFIILLIIT